MRNIDIQTVLRILDISERDLRSWINEFAEHLSPSAKDNNELQRFFTERDLCVLLYVQEQTEGDNSLDEIHNGLSGEKQLSESIMNFARLHTPLFQEVLEEIDETWRHGVLIGGMASRQCVQIARSYKLAADTLLAESLKSGETHEFDYPIFYLYRHCLELYLKAVLGGTVKGHDFAKLIKSLEDKYKSEVGGWVRERLWDFHEIDRKSDMFRYPENVSEGELWIDFHHLQAVMNRMATAFEQHLASERRLS